MKEYVTIIGCGKFGKFLAKHLREAGIEVQLVEKNEKTAHANRHLADDIKIIDVKDKKALMDIQIKNAREVIVCIRSNLTDSMLIVMNLKNIGVNKIRAMAVSEDHEMLLRALGATEILNPDEYLAKDMASKIKFPNLVDNLSCFEDRIITKQAPPVDFIGQNLAELELNKTFKVIVTDIYLPDGERIVPTGDHVISKGDTLVMFGPKDALEVFQKKQCRELDDEKNQS